MLRCFITDRHMAGGMVPLLASIERAIEDGVEYVQIREKDLSARALIALIEKIERKSCRILVNGRMDVALAAGADGLHLPANSLSPRCFLKIGRELRQPEFLIGVSCHSVQDVLRAEREGAGFALLGPIFATPSKAQYGEPLGLRVLHEAAHSAALPVFALGGVNETNQDQCRQAGARGIAGIRLFQARFG